MKRPSFQFYPGDWLHDSGLRACSLGARGLWVDMLCFMHQGTPYGHLTLPGALDTQKDTPRPILTPILARMVGASETEVKAHLTELANVGVYSVTADGVIFSRRMVADEKLREARAGYGIQSLNNPKVPRPKTPAKDTRRISFAPSPSSSSSSSSSSTSTARNETSESITTAEESSGFNPTEVSRILCSENGWSGEKMIWAFRDAIEFQSKHMPEASLEQVGRWLAKAYAERKLAKGDFAGGPQKFFEQALYRGSSAQSGAASAGNLADNPATRAKAQLEEK